MRRPDFLFVGPSKTASTWIYKVLNEHPSFELPSAKDTYFFDQFFNRGYSWYERFFSNIDTEKLTGEFSHDYIYQIEALNRIKEFDQDIKLIVCLRNPYQRTLSGINFLKRNGFESDSVKGYVERHSELIDGSLYGKNLTEIYQRFPKRNVLILDFEELSESPQAFLDRIYSFFSVPAMYPDWVLSKVNSAQSPRNKFLAKIAKKIALIMRRIGMATLVTRFKTSNLVNSLLFKHGAAKECLSKEERRYLSEFFDRDIDLLSELLERDFSEWKFKK